MNAYKLAAIGLLVLLGLVGWVTRFGAGELQSDTRTIQLGFAAAQTARAKPLDEATLDALERGYFSRELSARLDRPPHRAQLDEFWVDRCEVRQIDFERFVAWREQNGEAAPRSTSSGHRIAGLLHSPASGVDAADAELYCQSAGGRLPWAEELEALASGRNGRLYPWGDSFDGSFWPYQDSHRNASQPCAIHPRASSPEGVHDLANNVMEWSRGRRDAHPRDRRPGAHGAPPIRARGRALYALSSAWLPIGAHTRSHHLGFRCAYNQPPRAPFAWGARVDAARIAGGDYPLGVPADFPLARVAVLLPQAQHREARRMIGATKRARRLRVGVCEVSRAEYAAFLRHPLAQLGLFANQHEPRGENYTPHNWQSQRQNPTLPVSGVNWWAADAFARWAGGRLPRRDEWQLLAAGKDARDYPWGDEYSPAFAAAGIEHGVHACATNALDQNADGVFDLAGNVSEWTRSVVAERGDYAAWVQGGNPRLPPQTAARSVFGRLVPLNHQSPSIGFRVVFD